MPSNLIYAFGPYRFDSGNGRLIHGDRIMDLGPKIAELLTVFLQHPGQVMSKDDLLDKVWRDDESKDESNLFATISNLRRKLRDVEYIESVPGYGYRFMADVKPIDEVTSQPDATPPPGGAVPLDSSYYIARRTDEELYRAIARRDSIVLIKGARQVGKTSLLARGLQKARDTGAVVVLTDLQHPSKEAFRNSETLLFALGEKLAAQLDLKRGPHDTRNSLLSATTNFENYLRQEVLEKISAPLVWGLDEIDRLFDYDYASEIFGLFRTWHNLRALEPRGPWRRVTLAIAYATEAHLFITDLNQSPFNVGTRLALEDFTVEEVADLNRRFESPLRNQREIERYFALVGGHPYLVHRGLYEMSRRSLDLREVEAKGDLDEGIFGEHLRRMWVSLTRDETLTATMRNLLKGKRELAITSFYRLRSAGLLRGDSVHDAQLRCELYRRFLMMHLL